MQQRMALIQVNFENKGDTLLRPYNLDNKLAIAQATRMSSEHTLAKSQTHFDVPFCLTRSYSSCSDADVTSMGSPSEDSDAPVRSPTSKGDKGSIQKKVIKKEVSAKEAAENKRKYWLKLRQNKMGSTSRKEENSNKSALNMTYQFSSGKPISQIIAQEEKESKVQAPITRIEDITVDKGVCCLNKIPSNTTTTQMKVKGIGVFIEEDDDFFNFPAGNSKKFVVM